MLHATASNLVQNTSLAPYQASWLEEEAAHLLRRSSFGVSDSDLQNLAAFNSATEAVDFIIQQAFSAPEPAIPDWYTQPPQPNPANHITDMYSIQTNWMDAMVEGGLLERMKLYWSNHFAVAYFNENGDLPDRRKAFNRFAHVMFDYFLRLHSMALGSFKDLVKSISTCPAMLFYLDNHLNTRENPNENFARELLELFTLGEYDSDGLRNYSQQDVEQVARAVTGWVVLNNSFETRFIPALHDDGEKSIFGQSGYFNMDTVIDLIFDIKGAELSRFIARKLYTFFVHAVPNESVVSELGNHLQTNGFNIGETLRVLLGSEHFYEAGFRGCRIKSPIEYYMAFFREFQIVPDQARKNYVRVRMQGNSNEELLRPETVFGWDGYNPPKGEEATPGHYSWLNESDLPFRWQALTDLIMVRRMDVSPFRPELLMESLGEDASNPFEVARHLAKQLFAVPLEWVEIAPIEEDFAGDPNVRPDLTNYSELEINLAKHLLGPMPWYEWAVRYQESTSNRVITPVEELRLRQYLSYLIQLPSYQLY